MPDTISKTAIKDSFPKMMALVKKRLLAGAEAYGDISFSRSPLELTEEIEQEILDIIGWGWILFHRMERVKNALKENQTPPE